MTGSDYKKIIDEFLIINYEYLHECGSNILKGRKQYADDLIGELVIYLYKNQKKLEDYIDIQMLQAFCVSWMKLQCKHKTTPFWKKFSQSEETEWTGPDMFDDFESSVQFGEDDYIVDLRRIYTDNQVYKILLIHHIYPKLSEVHKILFNAYFIENLSYDKIKDKYTFFREKDGKKVYYKSKKSIYNLMKELKDEIKNKIEEYDNNFRNNSN